MLAFTNALFNPIKNTTNGTKYTYKPKLVYSLKNELIIVFSMKARISNKQLKMKQMNIDNFVTLSASESLDGITDANSYRPVARDDNTVHSDKRTWYSPSCSAEYTKGNAGARNSMKI